VAGRRARAGAPNPADQPIDRRAFLRRSLGAAALAAWPSGCGSGDPAPTDDGAIAHILPTVSHDRILLKVSLVETPAAPPVLEVGGRRVDGRQTDSAGRFWSFDATGLEPARRYGLEIRSAGQLLGEAWGLATFPHPDAAADGFRLLVYGCAGGHDIFPLYQTVETRQRLLQRALAEAPDAAVVSGDHVYWDLRSIPNALITGASPTGIDYAGEFDFALPIVGTPNETVLKRAVGPQIADLYGTMLRSTPTFFLRDDHDYFEDDRFTESFVAPPPDDLSLRLARATQHLYYPEFLPDLRRPRRLPGSDAGDRAAGLSEAFGTLRYGRLFEGLLYDCKGFVSLAGEGIVPPPVETWLHERTADRGVDHVVHLPSNPPGWSAGKYAEWYPDIVESDGTLNTATPKPGWKRAWNDQHNRILASASENRSIPLFMASDIHSLAEERIVRTGSVDLGTNPVVSVIAGTPGTRIGWPSAARGAPAAPSLTLDVEEVVPVTESNGFHIVDFEPGAVTIRHFGWDHRRQSVDEIDSMPPLAVSRYTSP